MDIALPVELMCIVFDHLPPPWWVAAVRVCRWWRMCIRTSWTLRRGPLAFKRAPHIGDTLDEAVRCGHVGAATWAAEIVGADLHDTVFTAAWMGFGPARSWQEAAIEAARTGRHNVVLWMARHVASLRESPAVEVAALYGHADCLGNLLPRLPFRIMRAGWRQRIVTCAIASGNAECVDLVLADRRFDVGLSSAFPAATAMPRFVEPILSRIRADKHDAHAVRWLAAQNLRLFQASTTGGHQQRGRDADAQGRDSELPVVVTDGVTHVAPWPTMRAPIVDDFLDGGALADYGMSADRQSCRYLMRDLLTPFVSGGRPYGTLCECIEMGIPKVPLPRLALRRR
ncbi:F-box domain-containing protein [Pandoravirus kuranda]|uniref:F-box domain-containing protein n=1 Tax=Pandoravirus kuranda TaxID=3019033 RepID=A0AA95EF37_9VIRU|nr:F-box domain-containing protein [Pandoravirus kuranda]